jgi:hypothetical protein
MRCRLEPMQKVARMLRAHEPPILNWFRAKGEISNGAVEGLNNKIRVITRRSYGFRTRNQNLPTDSAEEASFKRKNTDLVLEEGVEPSYPVKDAGF